jgi:hypothetical protein
MDAGMTAFQFLIGTMLLPFSMYRDSHTYTSFSSKPSGVPESAGQP